MVQSNPPTREEFLSAPLAHIAQVAPATMVYAAAGTRRGAALAGVPADSDAYARWSHRRMIDACRLIFDHGVEHIFTILATPGQFAEVGRYRQRLLDWIEWGVGGDEAAASYRQLRWSVRLITDGATPELDGLQERLAQEQAAQEQAALGLPPADRWQPGSKTLWLLVIADADALWRSVLAAVIERQAQSLEEARRAFYGADVPPATLYLGFGKPTLAPELLPPLLAGKLDCYWTQRPGYALTEPELRHTWQADKTDRAAAALADRAAWEQGPILGLGTRLGPFWYPQLPVPCIHAVTEGAAHSPQPVEVQ